VRQLAKEGKPLSSAYLDGFDELAIPDDDGNPPVIHPHSGRLNWPRSVPMRVADWQRARDGSARPMLHSKVLALAVTTYYCYQMFAGAVLKVHPRSADESANWSKAAPDPHQIRRLVE
jgi:hypothetical protein